MRQWILAMSVVSAMLLSSGCADPVVMSEVLQQREDQTICTRYNLWYLNPSEISSLNIQQGTFLPLGSEIEPIGTRYNPVTGRSKLTFRDRSGREYTIDFDPGSRLCSLRDFIAMTFTTDPPEELTKDIPSATCERIRAGQVVSGMTRREVMLAYGPPPAVRTPNLRNETWIYWISPTETVRVVFRGDKVRNVLNINE